MIAIKDYAKSKGVSYEAVRKQIARYRSELGEHIVKQNRVQLLDDEAVAFLDDKRATNPVVIVEKSKDDELEQLRSENNALLYKVAELQDKLLAEQQEVKALQKEKIDLLEASSQKKQGFFNRFFGKKG